MFPTNKKKKKSTQTNVSLYLDRILLFYLPFLQKFFFFFSPEKEKPSQ